MEPADQAQLQHKLGQQEALLESQRQQLLAVMQCVQTISHTFHHRLDSQYHHSCLERSSSDFR